MDTIICDISAFLFWRMPPLVRPLVLGAEDDATLWRIAAPERLARLRQEIVAASPLAGLADARAPNAHFGEAGSALLDALPLLAAFARGPVDVLVREPGERRTSQLVKPRVWAGALTETDVVHVAPGLAVVTPALALQQIAARTTTVRTAMLASELCGCFSVYRGPEPVTRLLQELFDEGRLASYGGWRAAADNEGRLTGLWSRPRFYTVERLRHLAEGAGSPRGRARLVEAAALALENAASPFEVQAGMLLGLPDSLGGEGYSGFSHNYELALNASARRLAGRGTCRCDLYWPASEGHRALDLECQSRLFHVGIESGLSDADRATALQSMGVEVLLVTYAQFSEVARFDALSAAVAEKIGRTPPAHTREFLGVRKELRSQVLVRWEDLLAGSS